MVGIVIVSHSEKLAEGVRDLANQMVQGRVPIAIAAGTGDPEHPIGTDAVQVQQAIESVYSDDGVLVLMDLGSAVMSAELAVEFLEPEQRANVCLSDAPLVEAAIAAAVQALGGGSLAEVAAEARGALAAKASQLHTAAPVAAPPAPAPPADGQSLRLRVANRLGLHARPAARLVTTVNRFPGEVTVSKGGPAVNARSINQVATLGVRQGDEITVTAAGPQAAGLLAALQALADDNFGDPPETETPPGPPSPVAAAPVAGRLLGVAASPGIAIGPLAFYRPALPEVTARTVADPAAEVARLHEAVTAAGAGLQALEQQAARRAGPAEAAIFEAHRLILQDPELLAAVRQRIEGQRLNAEAAWRQALQDIAARYRALDDDYMRARAADVLDAGQRVLGRLMAVEPPALELAEPAIVVAAEFTPSDVARLDPAKLLGLASELGSARSHSAILARAAAIPAVVGLGPQVWSLPEGETAALDGGEGWLWPDPDPAGLAALQARRAAWLADQQALKAAAHTLAATRDGRRVEIAANVGGPLDARLALEHGAEGVGLFRTEFLFLDRPAAPGEEEQYQAYRTVATMMGDRPVVIRTLDVGGDKPLPYLDLGREQNPFLGWRAIRFCLEQPEIFLPQLRAILRASSHGHVQLMFPMISSLAELRAAKAMLEQARQELRRQGRPFDEAMPVGIMVEVPAAVAVADRLAAESSFFSIGTNDLTQYVMAADRTNARVSALADPLQPAVLRLVQQTVSAGHAAGIWVGLCGELAGDPLATPILVGLGLDELSMNAPAIPAVKQAVARLAMDEARALAEAALRLDSAEAVRAAIPRPQGEQNA